MKKLLTLMMVVMVSLSSFAQKDVTKFLGIPVDGTVAAMKQKLIAKGFSPMAYGIDNQLKGTFNGEDVILSIVENNGKVWRIALVDINTRGETDIRIRYNNLCLQFLKNKKYINLQSEDQYLIPDNEDISYEMTVKNKRYEAVFLQMQNDSATMAEAVQKAICQKYTQAQIANPTEEQRADMIKIATEANFAAMEATVSNRPVWFMIEDNYGKYSILMYYDNRYNQANGEDL
mgnify:CR=1 FL=1